MTGYLLIRKSTFDAQSEARKKSLRCLGFEEWVEQLSDQPATYNSPTSIAFYVWSDTRWTEDQLALLGALFTNLAAFTGGLNTYFLGLSSSLRFRQLAAYTIGWSEGKGFVTYGADVPDGGTGNRGQEILTAQGTPGGMIFLTDLTGYTQV